MAVKPITEQEWDEYFWYEATSRLNNLDGKIICLRGIKKVPPPDDGNHYIEVTTYKDSEQKWALALQIIPDEEENK